MTEEPRVVRQEVDGVRWYGVNERLHISVTHVLSHWVPPRLKNWFIKTSAAEVAEVKDKTSGEGTAIHGEAEAGTEGRLEQLLVTLSAKRLKSECIVYSKNGWAGQVDLILEINGKRVLCDIKTGRFGQVWAQLGAYSLAANERGHDVEGVGVISLPRDLAKPAEFFDYSAHMEEGQIQWCELFDYWKWDNFKALANWPFLPGRSIFAYDWSPEARKASV